VSDQCDSSAESQKYVVPGAQNLMFGGIFPNCTVVQYKKQTLLLKGNYFSFEQNDFICPSIHNPICHKFNMFISGNDFSND